jgi:hypothetical protein
VTEAEWDGCTDPDAMLEALRGHASDRKLRLWSAACCRRVWAYLAADRARRAVEVSERYADGLARRGELIAAYGATTGLSHAELAAGWSAKLGKVKGPRTAAWFAAVASSPQVGPVERALGGRLDSPLQPPAEDVAAERRCQADLLRDLIGNPFHPVTPDPAWLAWHGGAIVKLAQAVYEDRDLPSGHLDAARLAVLADMLEEAGCSEADVLGHLRSPGPHVRGCWPLDLLLQRA